MNGEGGHFEYDEDIEAGESYEMESDESDESDEGYESDGEFYESDEDIESDEALDESFSAESDESDEAVDESDGETDEAFGEAVSMSASARLRASRDRNRRAAWARRIAADQRVEAKRATTTQQAITRQIQAVRPGGAARVASVGPLQGAGVVTAILPNGRRSRMRIVPTVAPISEVNRLRAVITVNDRRQALATTRNSRAIARLASAQSATVKKLSAEQVKSDKDLRKRLVEGDNRLDARITKELSGGAGVLGKHGKQMMAQLRQQRKRQIWNNITLASSLPFWAAFGDRQLFGRNNLTLGISTLGWLLGDELVDSFRSKSSAVKGGANLWSYLAPVGNGATVFFLLKDRQHNRFISGVSELKGPKEQKIAVTNSSLFKKKAAEEFKTQSHSVVASLISTNATLSPLPNLDLRARVDGDNLLLTMPGLGDAETARVAWIIDTKAEVQVNPTT